MGYGVQVDDEVAAAFKKALKVFEGLGHRLEEAAPKTISPFDIFTANTGTRRYLRLGLLLEKYPDEMTEYGKAAMEQARNSTGIEVARSWVELEKIRGTMLDFFEEYDLLLTPTTATPAFRIGKKIDMTSVAPFNAIFNLSRNPAASIPCGFSSEGLPIGLQIVGRLEDEVTVLQASAAFEQACPWTEKYPPVS